MATCCDVRSEEGGDEPVYRWTCPVCGTAGVTLHEERAKLNLQAHMQGRDDERHGPRHEFPPGYEPQGICPESG